MDFEPSPRRPRQYDVAALIGMLAALEGELTHDLDVIPEWAEGLARRLKRDGLLPHVSGRDLRQALNDLNHRLRYVAGETEVPPVPIPVI